jgi:hypothetical protein
LASRSAALSQYALYFIVFGVTLKAKNMFGSYLFLGRFDMSYDPNTYVNDIKAAEMMGCAPQSLRNWRHLGRGPAYSKRGRMVRYRVQDLLDYMASGRIDPESSD